MTRACLQNKLGANIALQPIEHHIVPMTLNSRIAIPDSLWENLKSLIEEFRTEGGAVAGPSPKG